MMDSIGMPGRVCVCMCVADGARHGNDGRSCSLCHRL